jgi:hypothetical protein
MGRRQGCQRSAQAAARPSGPITGTLAVTEAPDVVAVVGMQRPVIARCRRRATTESKPGSGVRPIDVRGAGEVGRQSVAWKNHTEQYKPLAEASPRRRWQLRSGAPQTRSYQFACCRKARRGSPDADRESSPAIDVNKLAHDMLPASRRHCTHPRRPSQDGGLNREAPLPGAGR